MTERINPNTGVKEELGFFGWRESLNESGNAERINPDTGVKEETGFFGWRESNNESGNAERVNPNTGVAEEQGLFGWREKSKKAGSVEPKSNVDNAPDGAAYSFESSDIGKGNSDNDRLGWPKSDSDIASYETSSGHSIRSPSSPAPERRSKLIPAIVIFALVLGLAGYSINESWQSSNSRVGEKKVNDGNSSPIRVHLSPEWLGTWKQQDGNMTITISAVKLAFDEVRNVDGEVDRFQYEHNWLEKVTANVEEGRFGYSGKRVAPSDIAVLLESAIARFRQDPADFGIGDPAASRRAIASISPGMHAVIWSYGGGEWYQEYIVDGDRMLQWTDDPHFGFGADLFNRVR